MQVTKENADMLKPGMLAVVSGKVLKFIGNGSTPLQLKFDRVDAKKGDGHGHTFIDLAWYQPIILIAG